MRFFRTASDEIYESVRLQLDAEWGHPSPNGTITCIEPATSAPRDGQGHIVLAVHDNFATWEPAATILAGLLASGEVVEIVEAEYRSAITVDYE